MSPAPQGAPVPKAITVTYTAPTTLPNKGSWNFNPDTLNVPAGETDDITFSLTTSNGTVNFTSFSFARVDGTTDTNVTNWNATGASANGKRFTIRDADPADQGADVKYKYTVHVAGKIGPTNFTDECDPMIINKKKV